MKRKWIAVGVGALWLAVGAGENGTLRASPQAPAQNPPQQAQQEKPAYTLAEYEAYKKADSEANPQQKIRLLDEFTKQYPNSTLLPYVYRAYYLTNYGLKNYAGTVEYADRMMALGDKVDNQGRLEAAVARAQAYYVGSSTDKALQTPEAQAKARDAAVLGLKEVEAWKKPDAVTAEQYEQQKKGFTVLFNTLAAMTSASVKDFPAAANYYNAVLAADPNDAVSYFRLGVVYLQMTPPKSIDGFWALSRSIGLKSPNGPNEQQVRTYLRNQLARYQQAACEKLTDEQVNQLITLAATTPQRPESLTVPSVEDLQKAREDTANFLASLRDGGEAGKVMWLASCGLEYPDVGVRIMGAPVVEGDVVTLSVFRGNTPEEIEAATEANMTVKVTGQPQAGALTKDDVVRFTGTLAGYSQSPFLLTWEKAKINPEDLPEKAGAPAKKARAKKTPAD